MRLDPPLVASLTGFLGAVAGGPAVERGLRRLAPESRRCGRWLIVPAGLGVSLVAPLRPGGTTAVARRGFRRLERAARVRHRPPHGCFPSLHVAYSFVSAVYAFTVAGFWLAWRVQAGAS